MREIKATSISAYYDHVVEGRARTQREKILDLLMNCGMPLSRRQIANVTHIEINAVCGRVKALLDSGLILVSHEEKSDQTGQTVEYLEPVWPQPQQRKFKF